MTLNIRKIIAENINFNGARQAQQGIRDDTQDCGESYRSR